jgi:peptidoglycan/xylan/chitin deacetylase (PgdA/CDA1 family)
MTLQAYLPSSGLIGKLKRQAARRLAKTPMRITLDRPLVSFSFDDFPKSAGEAGAEILERHGWRGTFFASGGFAGGENHLGKLYDIGDLKRLHASGHEIACHTFSHIDVTQTALSDVVAEIDRNRAYLDASGHEAPFETFAFPYGEASPAAKQALSPRFRALRGVRPGVNRDGADRTLLLAVPLDGGQSGLMRALKWVEDLKSRPGWLIFYGHDVRETPSEWGCTPAFMEAVCAAVTDSGADVDTIAGALERIDA